MDDGARGADPSVFEGAFVIEDDSEEPSRAGTPATPEAKPEITEEKGTTAENTGAVDSEVVNEKAEAPPKPSATDLPADVRSKLRKLDKLEARYQGMLFHSGIMSWEVYSHAKSCYVHIGLPMRARFQLSPSKRH